VPRSTVAAEEADYCDKCKRVKPMRDVSMVDGLFALLFDELLDCYDRLGLPMRQDNRIMRVSTLQLASDTGRRHRRRCRNDAGLARLLAVVGRENLRANPNYTGSEQRAGRNWPSKASFSCGHGVC